MWINDHIDLNPVFTIGYRERKFEDFLKILNEYQLDTLVDIRSQPVSRIQPEFSKRQIELFLNNAGIRYLYLGKELGGRPENPDVYFNGDLDVGKLQSQPLFIGGLNKILSMHSSGSRLVLMCAERLADHCHRKTIITPSLAAAELEVIHIE